jgi:hypothetical protein
VHVAISRCTRKIEGGAGLSSPPSDVTNPGSR